MSARCLIICLCAAAALAACAVTSESTEAPPAASPEVRAVWVASLAPGICSPEEVPETVSALRRANLNTLIAQVRRSGMVFYRSDLEPRATTITGPPDWDPLDAILDNAHDTSDGQQRLDVYAWFNVFSLGSQADLRGATPTPISEAHTEWYALDPDG
jgi:uncharacterized lipoprotein YddW (UPF0748 family)